MELLRSWGLEDEIRAGGAGRRVAGARASETLADADRGEVAALGLPTKDQAAVISPTAPLCAPQDHTEAVLLGLRPLARGRGASSAHEVLRLDVGDGGAEALVRRAAIGPRRQGALRDRGRRRPQHGPQRARDRDGRARARMPGESASAPRSPRRSGSSSANRATGSTRSSIPRSRASSCLRAVGTSGSSGSTRRSPTRLDEAEMTRLIRIAAGVPDLEPRIHGITTFSVRGGDRGPLLGGERFPDRRRGAPGQPARRHRDEQRDRRRVRPRLEARLGAARLGRRATCSTPTRRSGARSSPTTSSAPPTSEAPTATSSTRSTSTSGGGSTHLWVETGGALGLDARPRHRRADAVHRPGRRPCEAPATADGDAPVIVRSCRP